MASLDFFTYDKDSRTITVKDGTKAIPADAFKKFIFATTIVLPNSVTEIGNRACDQCIKLKNINIPDGVVEIGEAAFLHCLELTDIEIPMGCTLGKYAFAAHTNVRTRP